ncbi:sugar ABC transporter substrate-binding protein [Christensenella intestinihominis]|uniref:sugar ABC transporter substrate-binding protein n=1 Tax=Christensenella intestinihominis TaxID=1851429 RepID=UPI00082BF35D|nr:sugar ABC transporter substrate-binding protein [Christensenella intestinihominis]
MKKVLAVVLMCALVISLAACGAPQAEESTAASPSESVEASEQPSETQAAEESAGSSPEAAGGIDWAARGAAAVQPNPVEFGGPTEPAKAPEGIKVALVPSDSALDGPVVPAQGVEDAGKNFGWEVQWYNGKGNPADQNKGIMDAVSWGADVICCFSVDAASVQQGLKAAADAGIPVVSGSNGTDDPNTPAELEEGQLDFLLDVGVDYKAIGVAIADWIVADAGNEGKVAVFGAKEYPSCMMTEAGVLESLNESDMEISDVMYFTGGQVGDTLNRQVIGYLQANPDTKYIFLPYDPAAIEVTEALSTAGYTDVKVCSVLGTAQMQELIRAGSAAASAAYDMEYMGWGLADQIIRLLNDQELYSPHGENTPYCVIDAGNLPDEAGNWATSFDYKDKFLELWK